MNFFNMALDFIFPPICGICGEINKNYICTKCYKDIRKLEKCITNKYNNKYYSEHLYIFKYEGTIRKRIIEYKFEDKAYLYKTFSEIFIKNKTVCNYIKKYDDVDNFYKIHPKLDDGIEICDLMYIDKENKVIKMLFLKQGFGASTRDLAIQTTMGVKRFNSMANDEIKLKTERTIK